LSHGIDLVHYFLNDNFPISVVAHGRVFAWHDGRENPDTFQALLEYPKGFMVSFSTSFGNDSDSFSRIMGKKGTLINTGGEGSPRWKWVEEKGNHESNPFVKREERNVTLPGDDKIPPSYMGDEDLSHMTNWLECVRSRKALQRLNINTLSELASRTEDELLGCKNFGHTSLNEIKQQLGSFGIGLRKLEE
jgi:predicted dehydrogenase